MKPLCAAVRVLLIAAFVLVGPGWLFAQGCGDSDGDGRVTVTDGVNILRQAAGLSSACASDLRRCDVDGNGVVTVTDAVNDLRLATGLVASLACPAENGVGRFAGHYEGTFSGDDDGDFEVDVACDGDIEGSAESENTGDGYLVRGSVTQEGALTLTVGDVTSGATFHGTVDDDGKVSGQWSNRFDGSDGNFRGTRTSTGSCS